MGGNKRPICVDIVRAIANYEGAPAFKLDFALHDHMDTEALELLSRDRKGEWELTFRVPEHTITVQSDRTIAVDGYVFDTTTG